MGIVEQHLGGNAALSTFLHYEPSDLWKRPTGEVIRIEAFSLVAIFLSFVVVVFGSCRRWSNHWIVQKGFLAAQVLSLSVGTYSIGLMQSSPVKNEMYPIWAVSLLTLFGCIDPVTNYIGPDYKGLLLKMIFQLCLYYGYILLMSISTMSSGIVKVAIYVLSAVTFIKGFHRSLAVVQQRTSRVHITNTSFYPEPADFLAGGGERLKVHIRAYIPGSIYSRSLDHVWWTTMADIRKLKFKELTTTNGRTIEEVCLGYSLSHLLQRRFLGLTTTMEMEEKREEFQRLVHGGLTSTTHFDYDLVTSATHFDYNLVSPIVYPRRIIKDYRRALKVIEVELAFLYEVCFTSNEFLHLHQAKTASFWELVSLIGICFLGAVVAAIPDNPDEAAMTGSSATAPAGSGTTLLILVSLVLLQLVQLIRCWTSNWAIVSFACEVARKQNSNRCSWTMMVLRFREFLVTRMNNWFNKYLWQDKLGQYSVVDAKNSANTCYYCNWVHKFGVNYIVIGLSELLGSDTTNTEAGFRLHEDDDVKASIAEFLCQIKSSRIGVEWTSLFVDNGLKDILEDLPYSSNALHLQRLRRTTTTKASHAYAFAWRVMVWHIVTCYCEQVDQEQAAAGDGGSSSRSRRRNDKNRRVAIALSKYCAYLVVSAPELLPGPAAETKRAFDEAEQWKKSAMRRGQRHNILEVMTTSRPSWENWNDSYYSTNHVLQFYDKVVELGKKFLLLNNKTKMTTTNPEQQGEGEEEGEGEESAGNTQTNSSTDHWEVLALLWVQTLLYAAPYGDVQAHMQHLSQGGEFITHLWALLYHLGIENWEREEAPPLQPAAPAAESSREAAATEEDAVESWSEAA